jgi:hypothetical protein
MTKDEALKLALGFIERVNQDGWILADFERQIYATITAIKEALAQPEQDREEMKIKSVTMRCKDYDVALPIIYNDFGRVLVGQVSIPPNPKEPKQEPVAWMNDSTPSGIFARHMEGAKNFGCTIPLYTAPPQRTWVGLTDDEIQNIVDCGRPTVVNIRKAEQLLKEKNSHD